MADTSLVTRHPAKDSSQLLAPARPRRAMFVFNDGSTSLLLRFGEEDCGPGDFSLRIKPQELAGPFGISYDGALTGYSEKTSGSPPLKPTGVIRVTELLQ